MTCVLRWPHTRDYNLQLQVWYFHNLLQVLLVKIDLLNNLYHHMGTLLNAYISKQIVLQLLPRWVIFQLIFNLRYATI